MKLTVFQSDKGDCLLLEGNAGGRILVDGGMRDSYSEHVAPALGKLQAKKQGIDVVYVSHIDQDHISGVLQMMDDEVEWRIHDYQVKHGNPKHKPPASPRPPKVKHIWHNAFHAQLDRNVGEVGDMLAASAAILAGSDVGEVKELASRQADLVTSISEAIQLSQRVSPEQLGIKLNHPAGGKLIMVREKEKPGSPIKIGGLKIRVIGPFDQDLTELRKEWNEWLKNNKDKVKKIQASAAADASAFSVREIGDLIAPKLAQAQELEKDLAADIEFDKKKKLGVRKKVTTPNLASLMLYVEEGGKTLLLTGDGHWADIIKGLEHIGKLDPQDETSSIHVNVLKVQHHGSEHNVNLEFCQRVIADDYIFCGNGEHENPDLEVLKAVAASRFGGAKQVSQHAKTGRPFKFWFNSSRAMTQKKEAKDHMSKIKKLVAGLEKQGGGQLTSQFLEDGSSFTLKV
jgi:beta-lactamase superfamily II metal-dependent hydrolase